VGRMLLELVPGIWIIGGDEEGRGGEGDGGGLERSGIIGEERSGLPSPAGGKAICPSVATSPDPG